MSTREGRREGFVGWMRPRAFEEPYKNEVMTTSAQSEYTMPAYVTPLVEGEPVPGETWLDIGTRRVEIVTPAYDDEGRRAVVVRDTDGTTRERDVEWLTRAPETREVEVKIESPSDAHSGWVNIKNKRLTVPASMSDDDLMAAIRGAVEVETT